MINYTFAGLLKAHTYTIGWDSILLTPTPQTKVAEKDWYGYANTGWMWWWMVKYRKMFGSRRRQSNKLSLKKGDGELYVRIAHIVRSLATIFRRVCRSYFGIWGHLPFNRQIIMSTDSFDFIAASWFDVCKVLQTNSVSLFRSFSILH